MDISWIVYQYFPQLTSNSKAALLEEIMDGNRYLRRIFDKKHILNTFPVAPQLTSSIPGAFFQEVMDIFGLGGYLLSQYYPQLISNSPAWM